METEDKTTVLISVLFTLVVLGPTLCVLSGYVFLKMWFWFVLPVFTSLPEITLIQSIGFGFVVSTVQLNVARATKDDDPAKLALTQIAGYVLLLGLAYGFKVLFY
jgi:hypothetical protein